MKRYIVWLAALLLVSCSQNLSDYQGSLPTLDLQEYFEGDIKAWGVVAGRDGAIKRRFTAHIKASWQGNIGTLNEQFAFDDGEQQARVWTIEKRGEHYIGRAGDVIGEAKGQIEGYAMNWRYILEVAVDGAKWQINVNDWLYQLDNKVLFNQGEMTKFGIKVGQISLFMQKQ